jgi:hypothetical protein
LYTEKYIRLSFWHFSQNKNGIVHEISHDGIIYLDLGDGQWDRSLPRKFTKQIKILI